MTHTWHRCHCNHEGCQFCDGGLRVCDLCLGVEGSLPTDCPGVDMTENQRDDIYAGKLDFRAAKGWCKPDGTGCSMGDMSIIQDQRMR
jgi:hypothetical protein